MSQDKSIAQSPLKRSHTECIRCYEEAVVLQEQVRMRDGTTASCLAPVYGLDRFDPQVPCASYQGKYADAERLYRHALDVGETTLGRTHPDVVTITVLTPVSAHAQSCAIDQSAAATLNELN